jgi:hypothetical protein
MAGMRYFSRVPLWAAASRALGARYLLYTATGGWDGLIIVLFAELTLFRPSGATRRDAARARIGSAQLFRDSKRLAHCSPALFIWTLGRQRGVHSAALRKVSCSSASELVHLCQRYEPSQGLMRSTPQSSKSETLRVASLAPRSLVIAAICASA